MVILIYFVSFLAEFLVEMDYGVFVAARVLLLDVLDELFGSKYGKSAR